MRVLVAVTGASGSLYAERLVEELLLQPSVEKVYLVASDTGHKVCTHELKKPKDQERFSLLSALDGKVGEKLRVFQNSDFFSPLASGSSVPTHMVILPCSMGALGRICAGVSSNLIERAADVVLKQKRPLLLCPRETPLNAIHLRNLSELATFGAHIIPLMPGFYFLPKSIMELVDFMVGRILEILDLEHTLYKPWNSRMR